MVDDNLSYRTVDDRLNRLEKAVETLAFWLVEAQTGFGERDAQGIVDILHKDEVTDE